MKYLKIGIVSVLIFIFSVTPIFAHPRMDVGIESYIYNIVGPGTFMATPAPLPYRYAQSLYARDIGVASLMHINEITYHGGRFFITNGSSIIVLDYDFNLLEEISGINYPGGGFQSFTTLDGIFVTQDGEIYVAEPGAGRIIHLDADLNLVRTLGRPYGIPLPETFTFQPTKVAVDDNGRIYIIANNVFEGIIEMNPDGTFNRYFGVINVRTTLMDLFWRMLRSPTQRARMALWLPVSFSNLTVDPHGFVFATLSDGDTDVAVKKLNARGEDILRRPSDDHHVGDMIFNSFGLGTPMGPSIMIDVHVTDFGVYYALDRNRNRIFAYDSDGHLLFAFGGSGTRAGHTQIVTGMAISENTLVLADRGNQSLEVFELTAYGRNVLTAARYQYNADWDSAAGYWRQVLDLNPHFQYAHLGLGRWYYRMGYFEDAVRHFQRAQNVEYFNMAYIRTRGAFFDRHFNTIVIGLLVVVAAIIAFSATKRMRLVRKQRRGVAA